MSFIPFKFKKANAPTRLAFFEKQPTWGDLTSKIAQLFDIPPKDVGVAFVDKWKDAVTLYSEEHFIHFYKSLDRSSAEEIKFVIQDLRSPDGESTICFQSIMCWPATIRALMSSACAVFGLPWLSFISCRVCASVFCADVFYALMSFVHAGVLAGVLYHESLCFY